MKSQFSALLGKSFQDSSGRVRGVLVACLIRLEDETGEYREGKFKVGITSQEAAESYKTGIARPVCAALRRLGDKLPRVNWGKMTDGALTARITTINTGTDLADAIDGANSAAEAALKAPVSPVSAPAGSPLANATAPPAKGKPAPVANGAK